jgi:hypothetical protein
MAYNMKNEKITTFRKFNSALSERKALESEMRSSKKLIEATDSFHDAQLKLQELQKKYIGTPKENKTEREELKEAIINQTKIVKQKENIFQKALGDEDITDLEI